MSYPEHDKLKAIKDKSQCIGEFLDWLDSEKKIHLAEWANDGHLIRTFKSKVDLMAEFFEIDQTKLEDEKREMLEEQRALLERSDK